ncbi:hypothetical protein HH212_10155 [Massilia forsythiae]|uniref:Uncharacterized protein n=1 Tax=Massilia forsythiae TaxID=2728020 RepID=A0A7Z2VWV5_9BURK|nr:DUF6587 family protein [Massilia forsythiae]QJE00337.1 hypothetical protein HH212_10155 [Massilia forsythiae]
MLQTLVVAVIVALAALYAGARYLPLAWRRQLVYRFARGGEQGRLAKWLGTESGCGSGCDTCGSCAPEAPLPEQDAQGRKVIQLHVKR